MKRLFWTAAMVACATVLILPSASASSLIGSTVTGTLYTPDLNTILGGPTTAVVGASTPTFPVGSILGNTPFSINITGNQIFYYPATTVTYGVKPFNGFVFTFANAPTILGVSLDSASTFTPTGIWSTGNSVYLNLSGDSVRSTSVAVLDVQLQARPTPEPASWALMLSSVGLIRAVRFRRNS